MGVAPAAVLDVLPRKAASNCFDCSATTALFAPGLRFWKLGLFASSIWAMLSEKLPNVPWSEMLG